MIPELALHEALFLLALRPDGTPAPCWMSAALGGGILGELFLARALRTVERHGVDWIEPQAGVEVEGQLPNEVLDAIRSAPRPRTPREWLARASGWPGLVARTAQALCARGIVREESRQSWIFRRRAYPAVDPDVRARWVARVRQALLAAEPPTDDRTTLLVLLADHAGLTRHLLSLRESADTRPRLAELWSRNAPDGLLMEARKALPVRSFATTILPLVLRR